MHPHIPRPRRKATRTCTDTAGVVRTVHGEFMWPFTARVNENRTNRTDRCRCNLPPPKGRTQADLCSTVKRPTPGLRALPPMTAQIATALGPALDEPGALQQPSTVHVRYGSFASIALRTRVRLSPDFRHVRRLSDSSRCAKKKDSGTGVKADYSITSSACASNIGEIVRPSAFAVFMLISTGNLV